MTDYIDRQAAIDAVSSMFAPTPTQKDMVEDCLKIIENLPPAEVEPVKHGRWINAIYDMEFCFAECDQCHNKSIGIGEYTGNGFRYSFSRYRPNCGARMGEEE